MLLGGAVLENEYEILTHLHENEETTQRKISERTGLSLGAVNLLLKKMVRKGLIKIEKLNARNVRYILTPRGMREKTILTYRYIRQSYRQILKINLALDKLFAEKTEAGDGQAVIIFGPADELREILIQHLRHLDISYELCSDAGTLRNLNDGNGKLVLTWREDEEKVLDNRSNVVNILNIL